jgi:hypothetical protein
VRVVARDAAGALVYRGGRFASVEGDEAKAQLVREHLALRRGSDGMQPLRGVEVDALLAARATPAAVAAAVVEELRAEPLVEASTCAPIGAGLVTRPPVAGELRPAYALEVRAVLRSGGAVTIQVEVPGA